MSDSKKLDDKTNNELIQYLDEYIQNYFIENIPSELDILSTHTCIIGLSDIELNDIDNDEEHISFECTGMIDCSLQYGSDGDCQRGDGLESSNSFPFSLTGNAEISNIQNISIDKENIDIDTSSFTE